MSQDKQIKKLTIQELLNQDSYIIPIYQRNYAWGDTEIEALLTDMVKAYERKTANYYIGSLVVYLRDDDQFEVIDGQQRLTTFTLIKSLFQFSGCLKETPLSDKRNISFEYRAESDQALDNLQQPEDLPWNFKDAMQSIKRHWHTLVRDKNQTEIIEFILNRVQIIRTEVPPETDLNHYFEIMNTRGEQLEKHEVLKARFMSKLKDMHFQTAFARIWDACSDMNRYVVMGFEPNIRKQIFGEDWQQMLPEKFDDIADFYKPNDSSSVTAQKSEEQPPTMEQILKNQSAAPTQKNNEEKSERFNAVIDFPNFLLHVLRIYHEKIKQNLDAAREVNLDEKNLLDNFKVENFSIDEIKCLGILLLRYRYLLDCYVIKSDTNKGDNGHWSLLKIQPQAASSYQYKNSFGDTEAQNKIVMLLSMFHVSHPVRIYKNWLYAVLRWLYNQTDISINEYISFLEDLSDRYYFGNYGKGIDFFELITEENCDMHLSSDENNKLRNILNSGINVPNFIFNRLDYLLWKNKRIKNDKFSFSFRSSVEHFYPQNPTNGERLADDILHSLGNLCLISSSMNSKFSNNMPEAKVANFGKEQNLSLKLSLMMEQADKWNAETIKKHSEEMIELLNSKCL